MGLHETHEIQISETISTSTSIVKFTEHIEMRRVRVGERECTRVRRVYITKREILLMTW